MKTHFQFNSIIKGKLQKMVEDEIPELYNFITFAFINDKNIFFQDKINNVCLKIIMERGIPQGNPLSSLLYCLLQRPIIKTLSDKYQVKICSYIDDNKFIGKPEDVISCIDELYQEGKHIGNIPNLQKTTKT
jgi:hypothetical protein